jgi:hypothetical protein
MSSLKRWRQIGQGQFHKWEQPGEEYEGTWRGAHDGRFGPLGTLETSEGLMTFPLPTALRDRLQLVREGAAVRIQYTGMQTSKAGRVFKGFEVYVADDGPEVPSLRHAAQFLPRVVGEEG